MMASPDYYPYPQSDYNDQASEQSSVISTPVNYFSTTKDVYLDSYTYSTNTPLQSEYFNYNTQLPHSSKPYPVDVTSQLEVSNEALRFYPPSYPSPFYDYPIPSSEQQIIPSSSHSNHQFAPRLPPLAPAPSFSHSYPSPSPQPNQTTTSDSYTSQYSYPPTQQSRIALNPPPLTYSLATKRRLSPPLLPSPVSPDENAWPHKRRRLTLDDEYVRTPSPNNVSCDVPIVAPRAVRSEAMTSALRKWGTEIEKAAAVLDVPSLTSEVENDDAEGAEGDQVGSEEEDEFDEEEESDEEEDDSDDEYQPEEDEDEDDRVVKSRPVRSSRARSRQASS